MWMGHSRPSFLTLSFLCCPHSHRTHSITHQGLSTWPVTMADPPGHGQQPYWSNPERREVLNGGWSADVRNPIAVGSTTRGNVVFRNFQLRRPSNWQQRPSPSTCVQPEDQVVRGHEFNPTDDEKNIAKTHCAAEFRVRFVNVERKAQGKGTVAVNLTRKQVQIKWGQQAGAAKMAWNLCVELDRQRRRATPPQRELSRTELDQIVINQKGGGQDLRDLYPDFSLRNHKCKGGNRTVDLVGDPRSGTDAQLAQQAIKTYVAARDAAYTNAGKDQFFKDLMARKEEEKAQAEEEKEEPASSGSKRKVKAGKKKPEIKLKKFKKGDTIDDKFFPGFKKRHDPSSWTFSVPRNRIECECCCFPTLALKVAHPLHLFPTPPPLFSIRRPASHAPRQARLDQDAAALLSGIRGFDPGGGAR